ncbi:MAG: DUF177 domain-containing protein [Oscillospiraceae bacterium]|nr:DUF177 domain-containing protein [Oscillospiraceae bacterium]
MLLNLKHLGSGSTKAEETLDFTHGFDLSAVRLWGEFPFSEPVMVTGRVTCRLGIYTVSYTSRFKMHGTCSRCLSDVERETEDKFSHTVLVGAKDTGLSDGFIFAPGGELDLDELVISDILLQSSGVLLCDEECRGLCPKCGKNLNGGDCSCDHTIKDARFKVLREFTEGQQ